VRERWRKWRQAVECYGSVKRFANRRSAANHKLWSCRGNDL
jgi:hypothetical protein